MLAKLKSGVNFIKVLHAAFARTDPKSEKKTDSLTVFFVLLGSTQVKAACKTLMNLTPGEEPTNVVLETIAMLLSVRRLLAGPLIHQ